MAPDPQAVSTAVGLPPLLRPIRASDVERIARWYDTAVVLAGSPIPLGGLLAPTDRRRTLVVAESDGREPEGLIALALDDPKPGWVTVPLLAVAATEKRDVAAQAVAVLEAELHGQARHIRAAAPPDVGLALYFWLRLGYRPAVSAERLWMTRDFDTQGE